MKLPPCARAPAPLLAGFLAFLVPCARAQTTWLANPTSNIWNTAANWSTGAVPSANSATSFGASTITALRAELRLTLGTLQIEATAPSAYSFTFTSGTSSPNSLGGAGIVNLSAWAPTLIFESGISFRVISGATLADANVIMNGGPFEFRGLGGNSTIYQNGGSLNYFASANGENARLILSATLQVSNPADVIHMRFGSIEGSGTLGLGSATTTRACIQTR